MVILAAGRSERFGGCKQLEPIGPGGATLLEYAAFDAIRAGFRRVVMVIRPESEAAFRETVGRRIEKHVSVAFAHQRLEGLPEGFAPLPGRERPWGTGQALLSAESAVDGPLAVANADDFYGTSSFETMYSFLQASPGRVPTHALIGFALRETLTASGPVSRAVCDCGADGRLEGIVEVTGIEPCGRDGRTVDEAGAPRTLRGDLPVSMNLWAFQPAIFASVRDGFARFLKRHGRDERAEFQLPTVVDDLIRSAGARVNVLEARGSWCGLTHHDDKSRVADFIGRQVAAGLYPRELWK